jgi:hypothetical protein
MLPNNQSPAHEAVLLLHSSSDLDVFAVNEAVLDCILRLRNLTRMVNLETTIPHPSLYIRSYLTARIAVEYKLLRLGVETRLTNFSRTMCLAAQIYVNRVLRTFERGSLVVHRQAERLKASIETMLDNKLSHSKLPSCMVWVAVMGAIAAQDGSLRTWFVELIRSVCCDVGFINWKAVHNQLDSFLWPHKCLDNDSVLLWKEIEET